MTTRNPIAGTTRSALLLISGLLIGALFAAPPLVAALRDATGVATFREPFTSLAFLAAATKQLMVMTNVVVVPYRNPFLTAKAAATLSGSSG